MASGIATTFWNCLTFCTGKNKANLYGFLSVIIFQFVPQEYILHKLNRTRPPYFLSLSLCTDSLSLLFCAKCRLGNISGKDKGCKALDLNFEHLPSSFQLLHKHITNKFVFQIILFKNYFAFKSFLEILTNFKILIIIIISFKQRS